MEHHPPRGHASAASTARPPHGHDEAILAAILEAENPAMQRAVETLRRAAETDVPVLLVGEPGTGKHILAATTHRWSRRRDGPFVTLTCSRLGGGSAASARVGPWTRSVRRRTRTLRTLRAAAGGTAFFEELECLSPLRACPDDLHGMTDRLIAHYAARHRRPPIALTPETRRVIVAYDWPGNMRQLANVLERAVVLATGDTIDEAQLPAHVIAPSSSDPTAAGTLGDVERRYVRRAIVEAPTLREAAARLGIDRTSLWRMRKRWRLD